MKKSHILLLAFAVTALTCAGPFLCRDATAGFACSRYLDIDRCVTNTDPDDPCTGPLEPRCEFCVQPVIENFRCEDCVCISKDGSWHKAFTIRFKIHGNLGPVDPVTGDRGLECDDLDEFDRAKGTDFCFGGDSDRSGLFSDIHIEVERVIRENQPGGGSPPQADCIRGKENVKLTITDRDGKEVYKQYKSTSGLGVLGVKDFGGVCCDPYLNQVTTVLVPADKDDCRTKGSNLNETPCVVHLLYESEIDYDVSNPCDEFAYFVDELKISGVEICGCDP